MTLRVLESPFSGCRKQFDLERIIARVEPLGTVGAGDRCASCIVGAPRIGRTEDLLAEIAETQAGRRYF